MDHERFCNGRPRSLGSWYVQDENNSVDSPRRLTESSKAFGDILLRKSPPLTTGFAWPNTLMRTASMASSSQTSWACTTCTKMAIQPCSQDRRCRFSTSVCSSRLCPMPQKTSPLALLRPPLMRILILLRGSLPRSITSPMAGWDGIS